MAAEIFELNSFVNKFVNLWQAGWNASLKFDSQAGEASVTLHLDLGQAVPPQHVPTNTRERHRQRRADARKTTEEAVIEETNLVKEDELKVGATEKVVTIETFLNPVDKTVTNDDVDMCAEDAESEENEVGSLKCVECDRKCFSTIDFKEHQVNEHRVTSSPISQIDGASDIDELKPTYCKICEECPDEIETSEDVNYQVMNDHATNLVYEKYGKLWVNDRRYCIRRNSPFNKKF